MEIIKKIEQLARKTVRLATERKDPKTFEQKYKTINGRIRLFHSFFLDIITWNVNLRSTHNFLHFFQYATIQTFI